MKFLDRVAGRLDEGLADFSMEIARDGAWKLATEAADLSGNDLQQYIAAKDLKVDHFGNLVAHPGWLLQGLVWVIRVMEKGTIRNKISILDGYDA